MFRISLLTIGTELLNGMILESNSRWIENELAKHGLSLRRKMTVRDDDSEIADALAFLKKKSDLIVLSGGLGPTDDDRTREAAAAFTGKKLSSDPEILSDIRAKIRSMGVSVPVRNEKQALVIKGSVVVPNPKGTAPGFVILNNKPALAALPGVPSELESMFPKVLEIVSGHFKTVPEREDIFIRTIGLPEAWLDEKISASANPMGYSVGTVAHFGQVDIRLQPDIKGVKPAGKEEAVQKLRADLDKIPDIRDRIFSMSRDIGIEEALVNKMTVKGVKLALAESCTGGMISKLVTDVPGSSRAFLGGLVVYDNRLKTKLLGVDPTIIERHGAVSFETALAMAEGLRHSTGADYRVSVTGIAGPDGGSLDKPVGTVFIGFGKKDETAVMRFQFGGNRDNVRSRTAMKVFELLWLDLALGKVNYPELRGLKDLIIK